MLLSRFFPAAHVIRASASAVTVALTILILAPVSAWADEAKDRFELWAGCLPMQLVVESLPDDATTIGLTQDAIATAVRSRLRSARLYAPDFSFQNLYVQVHVAGAAAVVNIKFYKTITDSASNQVGYAVTWDTGGTGTHGGDANYILGAVSRHVDKFIDEYLRVNESACNR